MTNEENIKALTAASQQFLKTIEQVTGSSRAIIMWGFVDGNSGNTVSSYATGGTTVLADIEKLTFQLVGTMSTRMNANAKSII